MVRILIKQAQKYKYTDGISNKLREVRKNEIEKWNWSRYAEKAGDDSSNRNKIEQYELQIILMN